MLDERLLTLTLATTAMATTVVVAAARSCLPPPWRMESDDDDDDNDYVGDNLACAKRVPSGLAVRPLSPFGKFWDLSTSTRGGDNIL